MIDIDAIRGENLKKISREYAQQIFDKLLVDLYSERTHFIFELLQNAEDSLRERGGTENRAVQFRLYRNRLEFSHFGRPFNEQDVRSICDVNKSTKTRSGDAIGKHGIGFKSVYAFTSTPRVSSDGTEFEIETFIFPRPASCTGSKTKKGETLFVVPFNSPRISDEQAFDQLRSRLQSLDASSFLFLRQITYLSIQIDDVVVGEYVRQESAPTPAGFRPVTILWEAKGSTQEFHWLLLDESSTAEAAVSGSSVELAFKLSEKNGDLIALEHSELSVFFPTEQETHCGFLIQGPFETTPSRDNIDYQSPQNKALMSRAGALARKAMSALVSENRLGPDALQCFLTIPEYQATALKGGIFLPIYKQIWQCFASDAVIPLAGGGYGKATAVWFAPSKEVRELFPPSMQGANARAWVDDGITARLTPQLHQYLRNGLGISETNLLQLLRGLSAEDFATRSDEWLLQLYAVIGKLSEVRNAPALKHELPIIRRADNLHVAAFTSTGKPNAYLPGPLPSSLPLVSRALADDPTARELLKHVGLSIPDVVDEVVERVLPIFLTINPQNVSSLLPSLQAIMRAWRADTLGSAREKLRQSLSRTTWVLAVNTEGKRVLKRPDEVYLPTAKLSSLFEGVSEIWFADLELDFDAPKESVRDLLTKCGAREQLRRAPCSMHLSWEELSDLRKASGLDAFSRTLEEADFDVVGLSKVLEICAKNDRKRALMVWQSFLDLLRHDREQIFYGTYGWSYGHRSRQATFPARFVNSLQTRAWLTDPRNGQVVKPGELCFSDLDPEFQESKNEFLAELLGFKKEAIKQLAEEVSIPVDLLQLLQNATAGMGRADIIKMFAEKGVTLPRADAVPAGDEPKVSMPLEPEPAANPDDEASDGPNPSAQGSGSNQGLGLIRGAGTSGTEKHSGTPGGGARRPSGSNREFHSYISVRDDEPPHESSIPQEERMKIEDEAVALLMEADGQLFELKRMEPNHPGYDIEARERSSGQLVRLIEVKSLAGPWDRRPVTMSKAQFNKALATGDGYWLYVIENVRVKGAAKIHRIRNPGGNAKYYCFDHGWADIA